MVVTIREWHRDYVHVDMLKTLGGYLEISYGWNNMLLDLSLLTWNALACPFADVLTDVGPNKLVGY